MWGGGRLSPLRFDLMPSFETFIGSIGKQCDLQVDFTPDFRDAMEIILLSEGGRCLVEALRVALTNLDEKAWCALKVHSKKRKLDDDSIVDIFRLIDASGGVEVARRLKDKAPSTLSFHRGFVANSILKSSPNLVQVCVSLAIIVEDLVGECPGLLEMDHDARNHVITFQNNGATTASKMKFLRGLRSFKIDQVTPPTRVDLHRASHCVTVIIDEEEPDVPLTPSVSRKLQIIVRRIQKSLTHVEAECSDVRRCKVLADLEKDALRTMRITVEDSMSKLKPCLTGPGAVDAKKSLSILERVTSGIGLILKDLKIETMVEEAVRAQGVLERSMEIEQFLKITKTNDFRGLAERLSGMKIPPVSDHVDVAKLLEKPEEITGGHVLWLLWLMMRELCIKSKEAEDPALIIVVEEKLLKDLRESKVSEDDALLSELAKKMAINVMRDCHSKTAFGNFKVLLGHLERLTAAPTAPTAPTSSTAPAAPAALLSSESDSESSEYSYSSDDEDGA